MFGSYTTVHKQHNEDGTPQFTSNTVTHITLQNITFCFDRAFDRIPSVLQNGC